MRTSKKHAFRSLFALMAALLLLLSVGCSAPANSTGTDTPPQNTTKQQPSDKKDNPPAKSDPAPAKDAEKKASPDKANLQTTAATSAPSLPASATSVLAAGVISDSGVRLRSAPSADSSILTELSSGTVVSIFALENNWYKVDYDCQTGYISADLVTMHQSSDSLSGYVVTTDALNMRSSASTDSSVVTTVSQNTYLTLIGFENGWFHVSDGSSSGYISGDYASPCASKPAADNSGSSGSSGSDSSSSGGSSLPSGGNAGGSATGQAIADLAYSFLGYPYVYGGTGPSGFDCSGFIMYVYGQFGYSLPHGTNGQLGYGTPVDRSDLQPGDMIFFFDPDFGDGPTTHGGIYLGGGDFIHASTNGREEVQIHNLNTSSYYSSVFSAARRLAG